MTTETALVGALPTFVGSGILFVASGTMVVQCAKELFEKRDNVYVLQSIRATRLRNQLLTFSRFLITSYAFLFTTFFFHQLMRRLKLQLPEWVTSRISEEFLETGIYLLEISLFPAAVLFAALLVKRYIAIRAA